MIYGIESKRARRARRSGSLGSLPKLNNSSLEDARRNHMNKRRIKRLYQTRAARNKTFHKRLMQAIADIKRALRRTT